MRYTIELRREQYLGRERFDRLPLVLRVPPDAAAAAIPAFGLDERVGPERVLEKPPVARGRVRIEVRETDPTVVVEVKVRARRCAERVPVAAGIRVPVLLGAAAEALDVGTMRRRRLCDCEQVDCL